MDMKIPKTKEECFAQLDAMLSEEDKNELKNCEDTINYHFTLGMWIRNNWVYPSSNEDIQSLMQSLGKEDYYGITFTYFPDEVSSAIIDKYVEYLNNKE